MSSQPAAAPAPILLRRVVAIRHGQTDWSLSGQHTSITDLALTAEGREEAGRLAPIVSRVSFTTVLTSPMQRARETCALLGLAERAIVDRDLMEWSYGEYEGLTTKEIQARRPGWSVFVDGCPGGESPSEVATRVDRVIARLRAMEGDVAVFAHGHLLRVLAARWIGLPPAAGGQFLLDTATISVLAYERGVPALRRWNVPAVSADLLD